MQTQVDLAALAGAAKLPAPTTDTAARAAVVAATEAYLTKNSVWGQATTTRRLDLAPTAGEQRAAAWLSDDTEPNQLVATKAQCLVRTDDSSRPLSFWVSALSGQRVLLEGWAFTAQTDRDRRADGVRFDEQPTPWPDRLTISRDAIQRPTPRILAELLTTTA